MSKSIIISFIFSLLLHSVLLLFLAYPVRFKGKQNLLSQHITITIKNSYDSPSSYRKNLLIRSTKKIKSNENKIKNKPHKNYKDKFAGEKYNGLLEIPVKCINNPYPDYPVAAQFFNEQAKIQIAIKFDSSGNISHYKLIKGADNDSFNKVTYNTISKKWFIKKSSHCLESFNSNRWYIIDIIFNI